jgi:broad specificity phosphatase PhoE
MNLIRKRTGTPYSRSVGRSGWNPRRTPSSTPMIERLAASQFRDVIEAETFARGGSRGFPSMMQRPGALWLIRHGQSEGNVIRAATAADAETLEIAARDMDVPLSDLGRRQASAFGAWLHEQPEELWPEVILSSPYERSTQTAEALIEAAELDIGYIRDERLRERDLGMMDLLTTKGFAVRFPAEAAHRARLGKFYYRPPGGESWTDVALRCRSLLDSLTGQHGDQRVLLVTHEVVIIMFRYVLERLDETEALLLSSSATIANCSLTAYSPDDVGRLIPDAVAWTAPMEDFGTPVTEGSDARIASR